MAISVVVADDQDLVRAGLLMLLEAQTDIAVVGEVSDGPGAVEFALREHPDVVLMDVQMPGLSGIEATERIVRAGGEDHAAPVRVLILTTFADDEVLYPALRAGASGYLLKHAAPQDLPSAIRAVAAGQSWLDPRVAGGVMERAAGQPRPRIDGGRLAELLTPRELEVLALMAQGRTNRQIAEHLVLSEATVKTHVARVIAKTDSHDRAQAVALAYQSGVARP
ncbi:response regulator [Microlunatus soli]|uniref:DNA-binding response regulator, NarL/FixJ family, contains REC and HTH domains n=1 Tax=Microlunatus soli TaxID=630515 RepID=A0A1H1VRS1_9ACTN|nr:response regulator transcription factor [Microlunatus soli]SDS87597.1 DNA-binding response regulator, NarL/FixJ family, contains REC and HTH domains [Microlunatus soli]